MQQQNLWEELSDTGHMDEFLQDEYDFFVDKPPKAIFIPNPKGDLKQTQIFDDDPDLFDFENEVEPILQVLVGKSIEHARIEVIEEYEAHELAKHKKKFFQLKEAELMETQRLEEGRFRKNDEVDRRNLQLRTAKNTLVAAEKKIIARVFAKGFLSRFKRDTMQALVDLGALRRPRDLDVGSIYVPQLYGQIKYDMQSHVDHQAQMDDILHNSMKSIAKTHKLAIVQELNKRQERMKEAMK